MEFRSHQLENGLEIVAETNGDAHSMSVAFLVRAGSRDESDEVAGVSHFLEHMAFKGSERFSAEEVNRIFDDIGAIVIISALVVAYIAATFDPNDYKPRIEQVVHNQTGREFAIEGDIDLSVFPWLGIETGPAVLDEAPGREPTTHSFVLIP